ncbi:DEAD/DEAH box helicase [Carnobacteriaceae bacterium zg-C25]|nr:DEAD/DEAH box helicase [Carnobacteriaceae bacterium zg-C25]
MNFKQYEFKSFLVKALDDLKFNKPTSVQEKVIPLVLKGDSIIAQSQTGSGKSHSFLLPLIHQIDETLPQVQVMITSPSRELANQLYAVTKQLLVHSEITVSNFVGGTDKQRQIAKLQANQPHIVIGTPGRILDLMKENAIVPTYVNALVIDEADMTLDLGFLDDVDNIASQFSKELQMLVFSATIPQKLKPFLKKYMENPSEITIENEAIVATTVTNKLLSTKGQDPIELLHEVLTLGQPYLAMVFANTKQYVEKITYALREKGLKVAMIHGDVPARSRKQIMRQIQQLDYQFVVASDLAARGIDIEGVSLVVNMEIPKELDFFVHRVGRTGRNGLLGEAITFYTPEDDYSISLLEKRGIEFKPVVLKNGELQETFDRRRREKREKTAEVEKDAVVTGMIKKAKKRVKPGYKRKLNEQIKQRQRQTRKKANAANKKK